MQFTLGICQLHSLHQPIENLKQIKKLVIRAAEKGCQLVVLPEHAYYFGKEHLSAQAPLENHPMLTMLSQLAQQFQIDIITGTFYQKLKEQDKPANTVAYIDYKGQLLAHYAKSHPFDIDVLGQMTVKESDKITKGNQLCLVETRFGKIGLSVCFDLYFPTLYQKLANQGAELICVPANFPELMQPHWQPLLQARAIENSLYMIGAGQTGQKPTFQAIGQSTIVSPNGTILAQIGQEIGVLTCQIDTNLVQKQIADFKLRTPDNPSSTEEI